MNTYDEGLGLTTSGEIVTNQKNKFIGLRLYIGKSFKNYEFHLESLKFVYPWIFLEPRYITSKTERKNYLSRVHFDFDGERKYDSWGACISIEEAGKVVERINSFLEKQKEK